MNRFLEVKILIEFESDLDYNEVIDEFEQECDYTFLSTKNVKVVSTEWLSTNE